MARKKEYDSVNIKSIRKWKKLTQEKFAKKIGITRDLLAKYETDSAKIPFETAERIESIFKIDANDFYDKIFDQLTGGFVEASSTNAQLELLQDQMLAMSERVNIIEKENKKMRVELAKKTTNTATAKPGVQL